MYPNQCAICGAYPTVAEISGGQAHVCPPHWQVWRDGMEDEISDVYAYYADDAAIQFVTMWDEANADFTASGKVFVRAVVSGIVTPFLIFGETIAYYTALEDLSDVPESQDKTLDISV